MQKMDLKILRHSCSHVLASAVKKLYPEAKLGIGPAIEEGFYYDFDIPGGLSEEDLPKIEKLMEEEIKSKLPFSQKELSKEEAIDFFRKKGEIYKIELIKDLGKDKVSIFQHNDFIDLCKGPHLKDTGPLKNFKLLSVSGAYWRGDQKNAQLSRIYGTVFPDRKSLKKYLNRIEEAKKRDHRKLGKELGLFDIYPEQAGAGLVFYLPKGAILRKIITDWEIDQHLKRGYQMINTPHIMNKNLWDKSGHLDYYQEYMYPIKKEDQEFILKPMNCPGHILVYKSKLHSFRDLPLRLFELGTVYRFEKSGVLHGLLRLRGFTQDDAHIFCKKEDLYSEIEGVIEFVKSTMEKFGFSDYSAELSTRPDEFIGKQKDWEEAENILEEVLKKKKLNYKLNPGDGAFYGPKIDIILKDAIGRSWQCATVQLDYNIPERFDLTYRSKEDNDQRVVMIHRVILGSLERFMATLIEHFAGALPFWLAPTQISVLNINKDVADYAKRIKTKLEEEGFRVESDLDEETLQKKIRKKELLKIPYMVIVGRQEKEDKTISLRKRGKENLGSKKLEQLITFLKKEAK
ncbi:MAG: threonine--tRNA ligase [Candidatus Omnitrophica bacterium]|nr:threonine--tRNA ligase [Candidatus Omnitrophota bacterium]